MRQITKDLHWLTGLGGVINAYVWNGDTLLDIGAPLVAHAFFYEAKQAGLPKESFKRVLLSHCHIDHAGGLLHIGHPVDVHGFESDLHVLAGKIAPPRYHPRYGFLVEAVERLVPAFKFSHHHSPRPVEDGAVVAGWRAVHVPGHTPGSICWYQPESRTLFVGDVLVNHLAWLQGPAALFTPDYPQAIRSLQRLKELEIERVIFGHGLPLSDRAEERVHRLIDGLVTRLERRGTVVGRSASAR